MTRLVVLFLDGVGLGEDNADTNPLAVADLPVLHGLLSGQRLLAETVRSGMLHTTQASLVPTDACLGVTGRPQSATGQTALITGRNAAQLLGQHFGPRPNAALRALLQEPTLFSQALAQGHSAAFANAYPPDYFAAVARGKRLHGALPFAAQAAGLPLRTAEDLAAGRALSVDLTNAGWRSDLGYPAMPLWTPQQAGAVAAGLAATYDLLFFDNWAPDMAGHRGDKEPAIALLQDFDAFLGGLLAALDLNSTLVAITSDHGNIEALSVRGHSENAVPTVLIGAGHAQAAGNIHSLTDLLPAFLAVLNHREQRLIGN